MLVTILEKRKAIEKKEDSMMKYLRYWSVMVRSQIFSPKTKELAEISCPTKYVFENNIDNLLSDPMKKVKLIASTYNMIDLPDVDLVIDSFYCMAWCLFAFSVLRKKPKIAEMKDLVASAASIALPEVKSVGMIRSMISRVSPWQSKVNKALAACPCESKPFDFQALKKLSVDLSLLPVSTPEEFKLFNAIADGGARYCVCGGPNVQ